MNNTLGSVAWHLGLRQSTIRHFSKDFKINLKDYKIENNGSNKTYLKKEFVKYLVKQADFLRKYQKDYYSNKDLDTIANTINRNVEDIEPYLKRNYSQFFKNGELDISKRYIFRYISSYKIDFELSSDYSFLKTDLQLKK